MKISGIEVQPLLMSIAAKLAHETDEVQAEFFNTFAEELQKCCGTHYNAEMQATYIAHRATECFKGFCETICYKGDD